MEFTDTLDYSDTCKYIVRKNKELNLGLRDYDIEAVALMYEDEISAIVDRYVTTGLVENDLLLVNVVKEYVKSNKQIKSLDENDMDASMRERTAIDKAFSSHGGYGYNDSYDDHGLDEVVEEERSL